MGGKGSNKGKYGKSNSEFAQWRIASRHPESEAVFFWCLKGTGVGSVQLADSWICQPAPIKERCSHLCPAAEARDTSK